MAYELEALGRLVVKKPLTAMKLLERLFAENDSIVKVAAAIGIHQTTVSRWLQRLKADGHGDPRGGRRAPLMGRPKGTKNRAKYTRKPRKVSES